MAGNLGTEVCCSYMVWFFCTIVENKLERLKMNQYFIILDISKFNSGTINFNDFTSHLYFGSILVHRKQEVGGGGSTSSVQKN